MCNLFDGFEQMGAVTGIIKGRKGTGITENKGSCGEPQSLTS